MVLSEYVVYERTSDNAVKRVYAIGILYLFGVKNVSTRRLGCDSFMTHSRGHMSK